METQASASGARIRDPHPPEERAIEAATAFRTVIAYGPFKSSMASSFVSDFNGVAYNQVAKMRRQTVE
jgi:hypothetical protein